MQITRFTRLTRSKRLAQTIILGVFICFFNALWSLAYAATPTPRLKPPAPNVSDYLSDSDAKQFRAGVAAAKARKWTSLKTAIRRVNDPIAKDTLRWLAVSRNSQSSLEEATYVTQNLSSWPRMTSIRAKAEAKLFDNPIPASRAINWFQGHEPVSGEGRMVLARAHYAQGNKASGDLWLKSAWRESKLTRDRQKEVFRSFRNRLTKDDHAARADYLIWLGSSHFSKAEALIPHMDKAHGALTNARIRVSANRSGMDAAIKAVPSSLRDDPSLLYERARWRRKKKTKTYALPVYLQINRPTATENGKKKIWGEKRIMMRWAIEEKKYGEAYQLATNHGLTRGAEFAEAEFSAGWLAITYLGQPQKAAKHFETLRNGVSTPVSLARASYWQARAAERLGSADAELYYIEASIYPNTYYGQLAAHKANTDASHVSLPIEADTSAISSSFEGDARVRALRLLGEVREERYFSQFAFHLDDELGNTQELSLLSQLSKDYGYMRPSLRAAKQAGRFQSMLTDSGYPIIQEIESLSSQFDKEFVYAIARQESEFAGNAISSAKAYGMMQMINGTAKATARKHKIPYSRARMTADKDYSVKLGAHHLNDLLEQFDGSYILAAAGYNAGPHRSKQWIKAYGDPRTGEVDPIDWVESIPFSETRNYVQRVLENMNVYRARRNGDSHQNLILQDLTRGAY